MSDLQFCALYYHNLTIKGSQTTEGHKRGEGREKGDRAEKLRQKVWKGKGTGVGSERSEIFLSCTAA